MDSFFDFCLSKGTGDSWKSVVSLGLTLFGCVWRGRPRSPPRPPSLSESVCGVYIDVNCIAVSTYIERPKFLPLSPSLSLSPFLALPPLSCSSICVREWQWARMCIWCMCACVHECSMYVHECWMYVWLSNLFPWTRDCIFVCVCTRAGACACVYMCMCVCVAVLFVCPLCPLCLAYTCCTF